MRIAIAAAVVTALSAVPAWAAIDCKKAENKAQPVCHPLYACASSVTKELREYAEHVAETLLKCEKTRRESNSGGAADCTTDKQVLSLLANYAQEFERDVKSCYPATKPLAEQPGRALCPLESRSLDVFLRRVTSGDAQVEPNSLRLRITRLVQDLFVTEYPGCPRPVTVVQNPARSCANKITALATDKGHEAVQCFYSCEKVNLASSDACADDGNGSAVEDDTINCLDKKAGADGDLYPIVTGCTEADLATLGCPLGETTPQGLAGALSQRLLEFATDLNRDTFHSSCRTSLAGAPVPVIPAKVTLLPSMRTAEVSCGQVLDAAFFGNDKTVRFDTDLNCVAVEEALNGVIVTKSKVTIDGNGRTRTMSGPGNRRLRKGAGILVAAGVRKVRVVGFRRIQNFGVGVQDSGDNPLLRVLKSTFFRNVQAGVRSSSRKTVITDSTFDRNGIGIDLSGDNSLVKNKIFVRRSEPQTTDAQTPPSPGYGILLSGMDVDGNGRTVRVNSVTLDDNRVGVVVDGSGHLVASAKIQQSTETPPTDVRDGIHVIGSGNKLNTNSIKFHTGAGIVVTGDQNQLEANRCENNAGVGFVISGAGNVLGNNNAGAMPGRGNRLAGFVIGGTDTVVDTNRSEGNGGDGFVVETSTARFKSNFAGGNGGVGFRIAGAGNSLDTNKGEKNAGFEFDISAGNTDRRGNRANGSTFSFGSTAGTFE